MAPATKHARDRRKARAKKAVSRPGVVVGFALAKKEEGKKKCRGERGGEERDEMGEEGGEGVEGDREEGEEEEKEIWVPTKLVVSLKFTARGAAQVREILGGDEGEDGDGEVSEETHREQEQDHGAQDVAVAVAVAIDTSAPPPSLPTSSLLPVHHPTLLSILSPPPTAPPPLPPAYTWYPSAPPITTILPPGLPLSAHELLAFYPHHIRWKPLASRLARNGFTGTDIIGLQAWFRATPGPVEGEDPQPGQARHPLRPREVNQWLRDALRGPGGYVKGSGGTPLGAVMGRGDARLDTEGMHPRKIAGAERSGEVCSLRDLVRGVRRWPWGVGRRALTRVLEWYVSVEGGFTPRLEVSVLCVGAVVRALGVGEEEGRRTGPMNLDGAVLGAWRGEGGVERVVRWEEEGEKENEEEEDLRRSRVRINEAGGTVGVDVVLQLRHVLTFPYMAVGGMLCAALEMGIEKAEARKAEREAKERSARGGVDMQDVEMRDGDGELPEQDRHHQTASTKTNTPTPTPPSTRQAVLPIAPSQDTCMLHPPALPAPIHPLTPPTPAPAPAPGPGPPHIPSTSTVPLPPPPNPSHNAPPTFTITYASATPPSGTPFAFHSTGTTHQAFPHLTTLHATTPAPNPQAPTIPTRYPPGASTPSGYLPHRETCEGRIWDQEQYHQNQHHDTGERVSGAIGVSQTFLPPRGPASMMEHAGASDDNMAQYAYPPPGYRSGRQGGGEWWRR